MTRGVTRAVVQLVAVGTLILFAATGAAAKGPDQAELSGPGIEQPIMVRTPGSPTIGQHLSVLVMSSGIMDQLWCRSCGDLSAKQPASTLGPMYLVRYRVPSLIGGPTRWVEQQVYPFAEPEPLTYVAPGQRFWHQRTAGGWYEASDRLHTVLVGLGAQREPTSPPTTVVTDTLGAWPHWTVATWAAMCLAIVVVIAVGVVVLVRARSSTRAHPA